MYSNGGGSVDVTSVVSSVVDVVAVHRERGFARKRLSPQVFHQLIDEAHLLSFSALTSFDESSCWALGSSSSWEF